MSDRAEAQMLSMLTAASDRAMTRAWYGFMTGEKLLWSLLALAPLFGGMALGGWIGKRVSRAVFDGSVMALLGVLSLKLAWDALG